MDYRATETNGQATLFFDGELDMAVGDRVGELLQHYGGRNESVTVDFQGVSFVDSSGIGSLFFTTKELLALGKQVEIVNVREEILDILSVLGFTEALGISVAKAVETGFDAKPTDCI
ncbi:STAS domain-containing protein [Brevibacillus choshinensis]|uniref:STAS domain-containing protein n=1 Tax=Brevibacillus choshinensis TaxID=54911 RepID=UPI002E1CE42C|nr:STAS domain-containing protein [Brevibacillus choshinensis]MED4779131.1 STAS domain-containing protein [Brevibacillus choshinensis]